MLDRNFYIISVPSLFFLFVVCFVSLSFNLVVFRALLHILGILLVTGSTLLHIILTISILSNFSDSWYDHV
jgi:hypothetical protein